MTEIKVAFWNVQNLLDTTASPIAADLEFTPEQGWTTEVFAIKVTNLAKIIKQMHGGAGPDLLGLYEVENKGARPRYSAHQKWFLGPRCAHRSSTRKPRRGSATTSRSRSSLTPFRAFVLLCVRHLAGAAAAVACLGVRHRNHARARSCYATIVRAQYCRLEDT